MTRVIMHGCMGQMGQVISDLAESINDVTIVAGIDPRINMNMTYPVYPNLLECQQEADVVIDFSTAMAIDQLLEDCIALKMPLVLCTTGLSEKQLMKVDEASKIIPILKSANMSLGINTLLSLVKEAARILYSADFDIEVIEKHHRYKLDAPSGTAIALAEALREGCEENLSYIYDRSQQRQARSKNEIGLSAVRGGNIVGEHEVLFAGIDEEIIFSHKATSKAVFGKGAIEAAKFLVDKEAGLFSMAEVIRSKQSND